VISLKQKIKCVNDEVKRRKHYYPKLVESGRMPQDKADLEIITMQETLQLLTQLKGMTDQ